MMLTATVATPVFLMPVNAPVAPLMRWSRMTLPLMLMVPTEKMELSIPKFAPVPAFLLAMTLFEVMLSVAPATGPPPLEIPVNYASRSFAKGKKVSLWRDPWTYFRACFKYRFVRLGK